MLHTVLCVNQVMIRQLLDPAFAMFLYDEDTRFFWYDSSTSQCVLDTCLAVYMFCFMYSAGSTPIPLKLLYSLSSLAFFWGLQFIMACC